MPLWKLILAYDGTPFHGWQVQPRLATVQGTLAAAILQITGETLLPQGSGRTDTGVHALGQVVSFSLDSPIPPANFLRALNRALPPAIRVVSAEHAPAGFHARHSAIQKTYEYRIFPRISPESDSPGPAHPEPICPPTLAPYVWDCPWPIQLHRAQQAASLILGTHDFTSFAASDPDLAARRADVTPSAIRTVFHACWQLREGILIFRITGSGFLHHMVRNLVGTFVNAAAGRIHPESVRTILAARDRSAAGPTAPAGGLFLVEVTYPAEPPPHSGGGS